MTPLMGIESSILGASRRHVLGQGRIFREVKAVKSTMVIQRVSQIGFRTTHDFPGIIEMQWVTMSAYPPTLPSRNTEY